MTADDVATIRRRCAGVVRTASEPLESAASVGRYFDCGAEVVTLALLPEVGVSDPPARVEFLVQVAAERRSQDSGVARP